MRTRNLGNVPMERGAPPSTYCALAVYEGEPNAIPKFLGAFLVRSLFVMPGLAVAGLRGKKLLGASLAASASISVVLLGYYGYFFVREKNGTPAPWHNGWGVMQQPQTPPAVPAPSQTV
jgi:hypothetical protein